MGFLGAGPTAFRLGFFKDIYRKSTSCTFCDLVVHAICNSMFHRSRTPEAIVELDNARNKETECWIYSYCHIDKDPHGADSQKAYRIGISTRVGDEDEDSCGLADHEGDIELLAGDATNLHVSPFFHGRPLHPDRVDLELIRQWLSSCENEHRESCKPAGVEEPQQLLAIDVRRQCLCYLPQGSRYLALSYCWPTGRTFKLTRFHLNGLLEAGYLRSKMRELPLTIHDAINFVFDLGETFLWIDALCIIQDDEAHKRIQLSQMDRVYGSAVLTIVSAKATMDVADACSGLHRYRNNPQGRLQKISVVQNLRLLVPYESIISLVANSRWSSRGWTYQEGLLSRRVLYFTNLQVYFQCSCNVFCKDCVGEDNLLTTHISPLGNLFNPGAPWSADLTAGQLMGSLHLQRSPFKTNLQCAAEYENHLTAYSNRQLSFSEDILNAFRGILSVISKSMATDFWCGLPERHLDKALLWTLKGSHKPRVAFSDDGQHTNYYFPSWSWAGWDSAVELGSYFSTGGIRCDVNWFLISRKGEAISMNTEDIEGKSLFPQNGSQNVGMRDLQPEDSISISSRGDVDIDSQDWSHPKFLACCTKVAVFQLMGNIASLDRHGQIWRYADNLAISDNNGAWAGSIMLNRSWAATNIPQKKAWEFMLMSRIEDIPLSAYPKVEFYDGHIFARRPWCLLNVMMIERQGDVAKRLGVGVIHEDAWMAADLNSLLIKLE